MIALPLKVFTSSLRYLYACKTHVYPLSKGYKWNVLLTNSTGSIFKFVPVVFFKDWKLTSIQIAPLLDTSLQKVGHLKPGMISSVNLGLLDKETMQPCFQRLDTEDATEFFSIFQALTSNHQRQEQHFQLYW